MNKKIKHIITLAFLLVSVVSTAQVQVGGSVFGGGNLANVTGNSTVTINQANASIGEDVYGGGALADVNSSSTVNVLNGNVTGNVYGGGLGRKGDDPIAPTVDGVVTVNIGSGTENTTTHFANNDVSGSATIGGSVFGCNNANGSPTDDVFVNIWKTARTTAQLTSGNDYALYQVFGGGNQANYEPSSSNKKTTVHIWTCDNTIQYVYGGGNAADVGTSSTNSATDVIIDGGRIEWVFGGGNGAGASNPGAHIFGDVKVDYHAGQLTYLFGGSNEKGNISGSKTVNIINDGTCSNNHITELYGGSNLAPITGDVSLTMGCRPSNDPVEIGSLFGGSRNANITGNVTLTIEGGEYAEVFGGNNIGGTISGDVTLNLFGGTIGSAFGGNNAGGFINGKITVNMLDQGSCGLTVNNIYGGGKNAAYSPTTSGAYPEVNLIHGTVSKNTGVGGNVYGGGYGSTATVTSNPTVNIGYNSTTMTTLVSSLLPPPSTSLTTANVDVKGNVYGGGEAAPVAGSTSVTMQQASVSGLTANTNVRGDIYGGGNEADVSRSVVVNVTGGTVTQDVYGGGALADVNVTSGTLTSGATTAVTLSGGQARALYGGGLGSRETGSEVEAKVYGPVTVTVNDGTVTDVFGCNNQNGAPQSTVTVNINNNVAGNVYGGGNHAAYSGSPDVNIQNGTVSGNVFGGGNDITGTGGILNSDVEITGGTVLGGVYGGCKENGTVTGNSVVNILGGTIGSSEKLNNNNTTDVFGGGLGEHTKVNGNVTVTVSRATGENPPAAPTIYGDVYGGSALGEVNNNDYNVSTPTTNTTVNIYDGLLKTKRTQTGTNAAGQPIYVYTGGNVFGGGLGRKTGTPIPAKVYGPVTVNIGYGTPSTTEDGENFTGSATIEGNIYGCNNANGSPQQNVTVNILKTAQTDGTGDTPNNTINGDAYALANVFGGGNEADFQVEGKTATVNVYGCNNTIARTFGGGNAAASNEVFTMIQGGRIGEVFSGGNGEVSAANVNGNVNLTIHGGNIGQTFGGSNQQGFISGDFISVFDNNGPCDPMDIEDHYCGGKFADYVGNINATIQCSGGMNVRNLYGGCKQAHVVPKPADNEAGNVTLTVYGGTFENIYGGSEGTPTVGADITGNVTLNVYGGTVTHAIFGGSNIKGAIGGTITVNVEDKVTTDDCPLDVSDADVYGGGNVANYPGIPQEGGPLYDNAHPNDPITHTSPFNYPSVTIKNATVKNVFGGGLNAEVTGNPQVLIKKGAKVLGNVYGGGNMGQVNGSPRVIVNGNLK